MKTSIQGKSYCWSFKALDVCGLRWTSLNSMLLVFRSRCYVDFWDNHSLWPARKQEH